MSFINKILLLFLLSLPVYGYEVVCNGVDDTAALQYAIDVTNGNDEVFIKDVCRITSPLQVTSNVASTTIRGINRQVSVIKLASPVMDGIQVTGIAGLILDSLAIHSESHQTAGQMVLIDPVSGINSQSLFTDVSFNNPYIGINFVSAAMWKMDRVYPFFYTYAGVVVANQDWPDSGDASITNSHFVGDGDSGTAILQNSSSGLRISNIKVLDGQYGYVLNASPNTAMCDLWIVGSSMEGQLQANIQISVPSSTPWHHVIINGNELYDAAYGILIWQGGGVLDSVVITGNSIRPVNNGQNGAGIQLGWVNGFNITGNMLLLPSSTSKTGIYIAANNSNGIMSSNTIVGFQTKITNLSPSVTVK